MTLRDVLPNIVLHLQELLAANLKPVTQPSLPLLEHGLLDEQGQLTTKGRAFIIHMYPLADVLDVAVA